MVCEWGMSDKLGPISYTDTEEHLFLGREISRTKPHSESTALAIDQEIRNILINSYEEAKKIITDNKETCDRLAQALLKYELLNAADVEKIVKGLEINHKNGNLNSTTPGNKPENSISGQQNS